MQLITKVIDLKPKTRWRITGRRRGEQHRTTVDENLGKAAAEAFFDYLMSLGPKCEWRELEVWMMP